VFVNGLEILVRESELTIQEKELPSLQTSIVSFDREESTSQKGT